MDDSLGRGFEDSYESGIFDLFREDEDDEPFYDTIEYPFENQEDSIETEDRGEGYESGYNESDDEDQDIYYDSSVIPFWNIKGRPYAEPVLQSEDSRRYVSGKPSLTGAYQRGRGLLGFSEYAAPYGIDSRGSPLYGPAPYEQHYPTFDRLNMNINWKHAMNQLNEMGFQLIGQIGSGGFADVLEVSFEGKSLACKVMEIKRFKRKSLKSALEHMTNEINVLKGLSHPHILSIDSTIYIPDTQSGFPSLFVFILMDKMEASLTTLIHSWKRFTEEEARYWFLQISDGLYYLHSKNVSHLDIKPDNILYRRIGDNQFNYKLCDFGIAKAFGMDEPSLTKDRWGTPLYKAPELEGKTTYRSIGLESIWPKQYETKVCDIYSLGVSLGHSLIGKLMNKNTRAHKWIQNELISNQRYSPLHPVVDLLFHMTHHDPTKRYRIADVMNHPWVKNK